VRPVIKEIKVDRAMTDLEVNKVNPDMPVRPGQKVVKVLLDTLDFLVLMGSKEYREILEFLESQDYKDLLVCRACTTRYLMRPAVPDRKVCRVRLVRQELPVVMENEV